MMKIILQARSSTGGSYDVEFQAAESSVRAFSHCRAGVLQQMCKHKLALIKGETNVLHDPKQAALLDELHAWPQFSDLEKRTEEYEHDLRRIETAKDGLARQEKEIKTRFANGVTHGFK